MDGEIGRFSFTTYRVVPNPSAGEPSFSPELFPNQRGKEWYRTRGFKEIAFIHGSSEKSYRKTSKLINRMRHQPAATSARTLQDNSEREGERILEQLSVKSQAILQEHEFSPEGTPLQELSGEQKQSAYHLGGEVVESAVAICAERALEQGIKVINDKEIILAQMQSNPVAYEDAEKSINISVDDVGVKQQKQQRQSETSNAATTDSEHKYAYQTVIHIQQQQSRYVLRDLQINKTPVILEGMAQRDTVLCPKSLEKDRP